jgi:hypothetical protein
VTFALDDNIIFFIAHVKPEVTVMLIYSMTAENAAPGERMLGQSLSAQILFRFAEVNDWKR